MGQVAGAAGQGEQESCLAPPLHARPPRRQQGVALDGCGRQGGERSGLLPPPQPLTNAPRPPLRLQARRRSPTCRSTWPTPSAPPSGPTTWRACDWPLCSCAVQQWALAAPGPRCILRNRGPMRFRAKRPLVCSVRLCTVPCVLCTAVKFVVLSQTGGECAGVAGRAQLWLRRQALHESWPGSHHRDCCVHKHIALLSVANAVYLPLAEAEIASGSGQPPRFSR